MINDIVLKNNIVYLRGISIDDVDLIAKVAFDERIWPFLSTTIRTRQDVEAYVETAIANMTSGEEYTFIIIDQATGSIVGSTRFMDISRQHNRLEIGSTWITPNYWRTAINTNCKYLLLEYCFEILDMKRVQIKTDNENERSKQAIARIGAKFEGILRQHMTRKDGTIRDTAMFSVVHTEWQETKVHLQKLLGY